MNFAGHWRIVEMELWGQDAIDLLGPAFVEIKTDGQGSLRFIAVQGWMDTRDVDRAATSSTRSVAAAEQRGRPTARWRSGSSSTWATTHGSERTRRRFVHIHDRCGSFLD